MLPVFLYKSSKFDSEGHLLWWQLCGRWIPPRECTCRNRVHVGPYKCTLLLMVLRGNSGRGKSRQPRPSCLLRWWEPPLTTLSSGWLLRGSSFRPSGQRCPLSGSHSIGVFSREHNGDGKAADHTRSQWTTKFAAKKSTQSASASAMCELVCTSYLLLRANANKRQALSFRVQLTGSGAAAHPCQNWVL